MLRITVPLALLTALASTSAARAAPDDCVATPSERAAFVGARMLEQLDLGAGAANHPLWMRQFMRDADAEGERLARYCDTNPEANLAAAVERLFEPVSAAK